MASVRLPRMCCPVRDVGTDLVFGFSPGVYHAVCACSAVLGLGGTGLCYYHSYSRKKRQAVRMGGNVSLSSFLVTAGLGVFSAHSWNKPNPRPLPSILLNSVLWLSIPDFLSDQTALGAHILCVGIATWIHYFCSALFWAFFCFSLEVVQLLTPTPSKRLSGLYTSLCWGVSSLVGLHGLLMLVIPSTPDDRCETSEGLVLFHDALVYIPLILALFGSPVLLRKAMSTVPMVLRMQCGVYTSTERFRKHSLHKRLLQINGAFIACWLVNVLCDFLLFLLEVLGGSEPPRKLQVAAQTAWFITGILNPMFCALHSLAYFGWRCNRGVCQSSLLTESHPGVEGESNSALEEEHQLLGMKPPQITGKLSFPNILQFMDSWSSVEFSCSALEINAVRLLGARDSGSSTYVGSSLQPQHSFV